MCSRLPVSAASTVIADAIAQFASEFHPTAAGLFNYTLRQPLGVVAGITMVFVLSLGFFVTPQLLGSPTDSLISQYMYVKVEQLGETGIAGALGFILLWVTLAILALANRVVRPDQAYVAGTAVQ